MTTRLPMLLGALCLVTSATAAQAGRQRDPGRTGQRSHLSGDLYPCVTLYWAFTSNTVGGNGIYPLESRLSRAETEGSVWFSGEQNAKGRTEPGQYADLAPPLPAVSPDWSPVKHFNGYGEQ